MKCEVGWGKLQNEFLSSWVKLVDYNEFKASTGRNKAKVCVASEVGCTEQSFELWFQSMLRLYFFVAVGPSSVNCETD